jgi:hypothetical protein
LKTFIFVMKERALCTVHENSTLNILYLIAEKY